MVSMTWARRQHGFTIVELLIVIVVVAILAAITIVAYTGVQQRATASALQNEVSSVVKKAESIKISTTTNKYPADTTELGTSSSTLSYYYDSATDSYCVQSKKNNQVYSATKSNTTPTAASCTENGLLGWWKLNGDASDTTPIANNGAATATTSDVGQNGSAGQALGFSSASTSNVIIPHTPSLSSDPQTFSMWVRPTSWASATASTIIAKRASSANGYFIAYLNGSTSLIFDCGGSGGSNRWTPGYAPPLNTWTHLVFTCSTEGGVALYVNGNTTPQATRPTVDRSAMAASTSTLRFGQDPSGSALLWNGSLDDIRLYNRTLTPNEINALYTANAQ